MKNPFVRGYNFHAPATFLDILAAPPDNPCKGSPAIPASPERFDSIETL